MKRLIKFFAWIISIGIIAALIIMPRMVSSSIPSIYYITPSYKTYENTINCSGTLHPKQTTTIYMQSSAVTDKVLCAAGDRVEAGEVLVKINRQQSEKLAELAQTQLKDIATQKLSEQSSSIDWGAIASMYGLSAAINSNTLPVSISDIEGIIQDAAPQTGYPTQQPVLEDIKAPFSGIVTDVYIGDNATVPAAGSVLTIADTSSFKVIAQVGEGDISSINLGDKAEVRGVGFAGKSFLGYISSISPTARKVFSGTSSVTVVDVEIILTNSDPVLRSGFTAKVSIAGGENYDIMTVPYEAVRQDEQNNEYVYVYADGQIKKAAIMTGKELTNEVQVLSGIDPDSVVVFNPRDISGEGTIIQLKGRADVY